MVLCTVKQCAKLPSLGCFFKCAQQAPNPTLQMRKVTQSWVTLPRPRQSKCNAGTRPFQIPAPVFFLLLCTEPQCGWLENGSFFPSNECFVGSRSCSQRADFCFFPSLPILVLLPIQLSQLPPRNWHISLASSKKQPGKGIIYSPCRSLTIHLKVGQALADASALKSRATEVTWWLQGGGVQTGASNGSVYPIHKSVSSWVHIGLAQLNQDNASTLAFMPKRNYYRDQTSKKWSGLEVSIKGNKILLDRCNT